MQQTKHTYTVYLLLQASLIERVRVNSNTSTVKVSCITSGMGIMPVHEMPPKTVSSWKDPEITLSIGHQRAALTTSFSYAKPASKGYNCKLVVLPLTRFRSTLPQSEHLHPSLILHHHLEKGSVGKGEVFRLTLPEYF